MDPAALLPQFGGLAFTLLAFVVALSVIVAVHEYGHYIVGRWTGIHAEVFSLGFGPVLLARTDRRGTRWQVAALPFGGFVKFLGDANAASVGGRPVPERERRRTMLGAPLWARALTVAAGPVANFLLAVAVFAGVLLWEGRPGDPLTVAAVTPLPPAFAQGLRPGDRILAIDGQAVAPGGGLDLPDVPPGPAVPYTILRDGAEVTVDGPHPFAPVVDGVSPDGAAWDVEMRAGDVIVAVDGRPVSAFSEVVEAVEASEGRALLFEVWRDGRTLDFAVAPRRTDLPAEGGGFETSWKVGLMGGLAFEVETVTPSPGEALADGARQLLFVLSSSLQGFWSMVTGAISTCNLSGPVGIAETSGAMAAQGPASFLWFLAVLSAAVAS